MAAAKRTRKKKAAAEPQTELGQVIAATAKRYGGSMIRTATKMDPPVRISTGVFILDLALLGGMPHNRQSMIIGDRHSGKSTMLCLLIASIQYYYPDQVCVIIDLEGTFDRVWAATLGVDLERLLIVESDTGEQAVDIAEAMVQSRETSLVGIDSLAALTPFAELDEEAEKALVGAQARLVSRMVRKLTTALIRERKRGHLVTTMYLNQWRAKIGGFQKFGEPRSIPGGKALEYSTTVQMIMKNKEHTGKDDQDIDIVDYNDHAYTITKNKMNNGPRTGEFKLIRRPLPGQHLAVGDIDESLTLITYAKKMGYWTGAGQKQTLSFDDVSMNFKSQDQGVIMLNEDDDMAWALRCALIRQQAYNLGMPDDFIASIQ